MVLTARLLGPAEYGALATGLAVLSLAMVFTDLGIGDAAVQRLTRSPSGPARFWREVGPWRCAFASPLVPIGVLVALLAPSPTVRASGVLAAATPMALLLTNRVLSSRISEEFRGAAAWNSILSLCLSIGALAGALILARTATAATVAITIGLTVCGAIAARQARWALSRHTAAAWIRLGLPFGAIAAAVAMYSRGDRIFIAAIKGGDAAGEYVAAYNLVMMAAIAGTALHSAVLPRLVHESRQGRPPNWRARATVLAAFTTPGAALVMLFSSPIMSTLFGAQYADSDVVLRLLSPLVVLYIVNPFLSSALIAAHRQSKLAGIAGLTMLMSAFAYPILISRFGANGAAVASVSAELLNTTLIALALRGATAQRVPTVIIGSAE